MSLKLQQGSSKIKQIEHHDAAGAQATTPAVLAPGEVLAPAALAASPGLAVSSGSLIRIKVTADTYVEFSDEGIVSAPGAATSPGILLDASVNGGWHILRATGDMMRCSVAPARAELLGR